MTEFQIGDLVYVKQEVKVNDILVARTPPVPADRIGVAARIEYLTDTNVSSASIRYESDGSHATIAVHWLAPWQDFATIKEVEDYLDD